MPTDPLPPEPGEVEMHQRALAGDGWARTLEEARIRQATETIDTRTRDRITGHKCVSADLHEPHDHDEEVWSEPRWVNPRTIWKRHCAGVRDESPYPRVFHRDDQYGVQVFKQDRMAPAGSFRLCRKLHVSRPVSTADGSVLNVGVELWNKPPREWPPRHVGSKGAGVNIDLEEAKALRGFLDLVISEHEDSSA